MPSFNDLYEKHGSIKGIARSLKTSYRQARKLYVEARAAGEVGEIRVGAKTRGEQAAPVAPPAPEGAVKARATKVRPLPAGWETRRYILTCAQNATKIHGPTWQNLMALAKHYDADVMVSRFTYMKVGLGARGDKSDFVRTRYTGDGSSLWWDPKLTPFINDDRVQLAPGLVYHGEMNTLPTADDPLSGLEVYAGRKSSIIPHPKVAMRSVPTPSYGRAKFLYTTGTVTQRNYIQRKAGLKAEFHHCYGALLVEVDSKGNWWCRQLNADSEGVIYDLNLKVEGGRVTDGHRAEAIYWPDLHAIEISKRSDAAFHAAFHPGGILDTLQPKQQFIGDVASFRGRSHHEIKDPHKMFKRHVRGEADIAGELRLTASHLAMIHRPWCQSHIVWSNHDDHFAQWAAMENGLRDPVNAEFWLELNRRMLSCIRQDVRRNPVSHGLEIVLEGRVADKFNWLPADSQHIVCPDANGGIEMSMHGHLGPNGRRGNPQAFAKMGRKACIGHMHGAGIWDGIYVAGTFGDLQPDWAKGPGNWSHSAVVVYPNGKRAILTIWNGKAWAG